MQDDKTIREIKSRWQTLDILSHWTTLTPSRRSRVISDIEESAIGLSSSERHKELARDYLVALDALEAIASSNMTQILNQAATDMKTLLDIIENQKK